MANTGNKIVLTLKRIKNPGNIDTLERKNNVPSDPDYIPISEDLVACPVTYLLTCPVLLYTKGSTTLEYEFNLSNDVVKNPAIKKIVVTLSAGVFSHTYVLPHTPSPNYFFGTFTGLTALTDYNFVITYLGSTDNVLQTCNVDVP